MTCIKAGAKNGVKNIVRGAFAAALCVVMAGGGEALAGASDQGAVRSEAITSPRVVSTNAPAYAPVYAPTYAVAQSSNPFSALVGKKRKRDPDRASRSKIERYVLAADDRTFLFEDFSSLARVKFLCAPADTRIECVIDPDGPAEEIYVLTANRGPRGDIIYKTHEGDAMLRIASYGGATVFWPGDRVGSAASKSYGEAQSLHLAFTQTRQARQRAQSATGLLSALIGAPVVFDIGSVPSADTYNAAVLADAVVAAAKGLGNVAADPTGARIIASRIKRVRFTPSDGAGLALDGKVIEVFYNEHLDIEGRPSSAAMARFLEESL